MSERSKEHASKACEGETLREFESRLIRSTPWVPPAGFLVIKPKTARFQRFHGVSPHQAGLRRGAYRYMSWRILGDALGAWWARAATPVRMIGNNFGPYMPWRDVWETGTLFRSACASCMPRHAKLNKIVGKQQLRAVSCDLYIPGHTQLAMLLTDWARRLPSVMRRMPGHT